MSLNSSQFNISKTRKLLTKLSSFVRLQAISFQRPLNTLVWFKTNLVWMKVFLDGFQISISQSKVLAESVFSFQQPSKYLLHGHLVATQLHRGIGGQTVRPGAPSLWLPCSALWQPPTVSWAKGLCLFEDLFHSKLWLDSGKPNLHLRLFSHSKERIWRVMESRTGSFSLAREEGANCTQLLSGKRTPR